MNVYCCDRCGKPIEGNNYKRIHSTRMDGWKCVPVTYELCMDCFADFEKFMEECKNAETQEK